MLIYVILCYILHIAVLLAGDTLQGHDQQAQRIVKFQGSFMRLKDTGKAVKNDLMNNVIERIGTRLSTFG